MYNNDNLTLLKDFIAKNSKIHEIISSKKPKQSKFILSQKGKKSENIEVRRKFAIPTFLLEPDREHSIPRTEDRSTYLGVETILPGICFYFLNEECVEERCLQSHELPHSEDIFGKLCEIGCGKSAELFRVIIVRCPMLRYKYTTTFIRFFSAKKMIYEMINIIEFCEDPSFKMISVMDYLVKEFMSMGMSYSEAVTLIIKNQKRRTNQTYSMLIDRMKFRDVNESQVIAIITSLFDDSAFHFDKETIDFFLNLACQLKGNNLIGKMCEILQKVQYNNQIVGHLDETIFIEFMSLQR